VVVNTGAGNADGAEFMHQAAARQPKALRLILGDVAEQELIISCIGATHQFIAKPCKPQDLISTIQRALALDACTSSDQIRALVPKLRRLPSLPTTYFEVLKQVESSSVTVQAVGEVIMRDPAMTARLLQMVNSAAFALAQKVTDPTDAVALLGMETVKSLVLCLQVFNQSETAKQSGISLDQLWNHSLTVAKFAREIALLQTGNALMANEAFTAGLLHDVGRIVMVSNLPAEYAEAVKTAQELKQPLQVQEALKFGVDHAAVGGYLMGLWGMPAALVEAATLHHSPGRSPAHEFSLLTAVHAADVFAHEKEAGNSEFVQPQLDLNYLNLLGLDAKPAVWRRALLGGKDGSRDTGKIAKAEKSISPSSAKPTVVPPVVTPLVPSLPVKPAKGGNSLAKILAPVGAVVVIVASIFLWQHYFKASVVLKAEAKRVNSPVVAAAFPATPVVPKPIPVVAPAPTPQVVQAPKPGPAPVVVSPLDSIALQGVLLDGDDSTAILNGRTLSVGERINGVMVEAITSSGVTLGYYGHRKVLRVR
jgi:HD-like signal output (HDOD) protein